MLSSRKSTARLLGVFLLMLEAILLPRASQGADRIARLEWKAVENSDGQMQVILAGVPKPMASTLRDWKADDPRWSRLLKVQVGDQPDLQRPAIVGHYDVQDDRIGFSPQFPWRAGMTYCVTTDPEIWRAIDPALLRPDQPFVFTVPANTTPVATRVTGVYPSADRLPENLLRFYLHFSAPMRHGAVYQHVQLLDADGQPIELAFLEIAEELWSTDGRRITLLFDPGRVKQGLKPREDDGPVLEAGKAYTLVVDAAWEDAHGNPLALEFRKSFTTESADIQQPNPNRWRLIAPPVGGRAPLQIEFDEPIDHAMLHRVLEVQDGAGEILRGDVSLGDDERQWLFVPEKSWTSGNYTIRIETILEDIAGNSLRRPFEAEITDKEQPPVDDFLDLPFEITANK